MATFPDSRKGSRGLALVIVAGVLAILAVLATCFVTLARLERRASERRLDRSRAVLLARSGIEDALARIEVGQDPTPSVPSDPLLHPSFAALASAVIQVDGRPRGWSGRLAGDQAPLGNTYALKIEDESAKINVNGGFLDAGDRDGDSLPDHRDGDVASLPSQGLPAESAAGRGWNAQLKRVLGILGNQPELGLPTLGTDVLAARPSGGYRSLAQLQALIGTGADLSPWLTVSTWSDPDVIHPNAWIDTGLVPTESNYGDLNSVATLAGLKQRRTPLALEEGGRPPVNLNAASRPVLIALIQGLTGQSWELPGMAGVTVTTIPPALAGDIADALIASRPFGAWTDFEAFCDDLAPGTVQGFNQVTLWGGPSPQAWGGGNLSVSDILKANFNPNTRSNKELPDQLLWKWIDKTDLSIWSTEGSLYSTGAFRVSASARVGTRDGRTRAAAAVSVQARAFTLLRRTSQRQFTASQSGFSLADDPAAPPQRTYGAGASWNVSGGGCGLGAVSGPCAPMALADWAPGTDGRIALATTETDPADPFPGHKLTFLQHFDDGWDADLGAAPGRLPAPGGEDAALQTLLDRPVWPTAVTELPAGIYPDGAHIETARCPVYDGQANLPGAASRAGLSYWTKYTYEPDGTGAGVSQFALRGSDPTDPYPIFWVGLDYYGAWNVALLRATGSSRFAMLSEAPPTAAPLKTPGLRWHLVTCHLDLNAGGEGEDLSFRVDVTAAPGGGIPSGLPSPPLFDCQSGWLSPLGTVTVVPFSPFAWMFLGYSAAIDVPANQLIDEVAIADFGPDASEAAFLAGQWALARYRDGRYYKGEGRFLSAPLDPVIPSRLLKVWWTACLPSERREELVLDLWNNVMPAAGAPRTPDSLAQGRCRVSLDLLTPAGTLDTSTVPGADPAFLGTLVQGGSVGRLLRSFRYRVRLGVDLDDPDNSPVLESPVFDDVTFALQPASGPRVVSWE